ncbi:MAG: hypothetical protein OSA06_05080 [Acidimicrobiales bacterium]|nr:hypothetical protein [Acidimicrobiales bacterium]
MTQPLNEDAANPIVRFALSLLVLSLAVFWFWALLLAPSGNPDRLEDRTWATSAEARCAAFRVELAALPAATEATTPDQRADQIDVVSALLSEMLSDLESLSGGTVDDQQMVALWLSDWQIHLGDRASFSERMRSDGDVAPLLTTTEEGGSYLSRQNGFARVNDMDSCLDAGDF